MVQENCDKTDTHFCAFDELYSGTNPDEAVMSAYAFITYLMKYKRVHYILTTHFIDFCNKIDSSDIPDFITLLQMLYEKLYNLKDYNLDNSKLSETSSTIIKFILHALVEEKKIVIDDDKKILFLSQSDKLIDACMNLLHFHHNLKAKDCCTIM
jgi:hypothetical protein